MHDGKKPADHHPTLLTVELRELGPRSTEITLRQDQLLTVMDREGKLEALLEGLPAAVTTSSA